MLSIPKKEDDQCPPSLPEIAATVANDVNVMPYESVVQIFMEKLSFSAVQLEELEKLSRSQSLSKTWFNQRVGRLTSSNHHDAKIKIDSILRQKKNVVLTPLLATILGCGPSLNSLPSVRWGRANEDKAANDFFKQIVKAHDSPRLYSSGLFVCPQMPFIAASPDRIMSCKCCPRYGIEIKCPYILRNQSFEDAWKDLGFIEEVEGKRQLKRNHKYYAQVQGQTGCAGYENSFFVVWDPVSPAPYIEEIAFDRLFWDEMVKSLSIFFKQYVLKYLVGIYSLKFCGHCGKYLLTDEEISGANEMQAKFECNTCNTQFHRKCSNQIDGICEGCTAKIIDEDIQ